MQLASGLCRMHINFVRHSEGVRALVKSGLGGRGKVRKILK